MEKLPSFSREERHDMRQVIDLALVMKLSEQIRETSIEASKVAKRMQNETLSDAERDSLADELKVLVDKGFDLAQERAAVCAQQ